jgi:hypothetical protein
MSANIPPVDFSDYFASHARHLERMRELNEKDRELDAQDAQNRAHHDEMMKILNDNKNLFEAYKHARNGYDRMDAQCDALLDIIREHLPTMGITKEEINSRLAAARESTKLSYPE